MSNGFTVNSSVTTAELESSLVVLDLSSNAYFRLNEMGIEIWRKIEDGADEESIVDDLTSKYDAERSQIAGDVRGFIEGLETAGLIVSGRVENSQ